MANFVSQVKLPNNTTYIIRDPNARTLDNNDFDTINVTELNAGNLIVTGVGRFTNGLYGDLIGNADTASSAIKATQDESGNNIKSTYASAISISDHTITLKNKNGTSLGTVTVPDNNTTYTIATGTANGKIKVTPSSGSAYEVSVYGLKSAAYKDVVDTYSATGTDPVSGKAVAAAIGALPEPMVFKGSLGTGGTITTLPVDGTAKVGDTYKVITAGTYASKSAKVGDTFICLTKTSSANTWELIPSGDEPAGTVTSVAIANGGGLSVSGSPITSSGTITISHADTSSQASVNNSGRTYIQDITLDTYGHVTGITSATETVVNTDRYVNSAAFADATSADANNPVKMTLTRAGSDTASVTAYIPKVSSSSAGVVPKGATVSSQSQSTKFLREDGTWATPSYTTNTNTTYSLSASGESVVLSGSDNSSSTADLSSTFAKYTPYKGNLTGTISSNSPAVELQAYWDDNDKIKLQSVNTAYNTSGTEYSFLLSKGGSNRYGTVLRWSYSTKYIEILRKGINWLSTDWERINAGYADTAGSSANASQLTRNSILDTTDKLDAFTGAALRYANVSGGIVTSSTDGLVMTIPWNEKYGQQIYFDDSSYVIKHRYNNNGTWSDWKSLIDESNINDYAPTKTGTGASGTWGISISGSATSATTASKLGSSNVGSATQPIYLNGGTATACTYTLGKSVPSDAVFTDTKNTAGSTDTSSKIFLIGSTSQAANPQTYSQDTAYVGTDGCLYSGGTKVLTAHQDISGKADKSATVSTVTWSNNKLTKTINGTTSDVVSASDILDNLTSSQVTTALGYTPGPSYEFESSDDSIDISSSMVLGRETVNLKLNSVSWNNISGKPSTFAPSAHDHTYLASAGTNTQSTSSTAYALGSFNVRWFTETGKIPHQPSQWGFLLTVATGTNSAENHQIFMEQSNGNLYHRGTNGSTSSSPPAFKTILDSSNYTSYTRNSSGVIKVKSVNKTPTNAGTSLASPTPSIDSGYKFLCWLYVQSNGYIVGANYPGGAANPSATWWFANGYLANYGLTFYYLEIKDTI